MRLIKATGCILFIVVTLFNGVKSYGASPPYTATITLGSPYVQLNADDDNNNSAADKGDSGTVSGENDLVSITLSTNYPSSVPAKLEATGGGSKINGKLWNSATKGTDTSLPWNGNLSSAQSKTFYIEGYSTSADVNDVTLKLTVDIPEPTPDAEDTKSLTVFDLTITKCDSAWAPKGGSEDNTTTFTATLSPSVISGIFKFTLLESVSTETGFCLNAPRYPPLTGEDSASWKDLQFPEQSGYNISGDDKDVATSVNASSSATVTVKSFDYGSYGDIKAQAQLSGAWYTAHVVGGVKQYTRIPLDENPKNDIWDNWSGEGASEYSDSDSNPAGNGTSGDRLARYEEYRGFMVGGSHTRTNPYKKDVFINDDGGINKPDYFTESNLDAPIHWVNNSQLDGTRSINFNFGYNHLSTQKAIQQKKDVDVSKREYLFGESKITTPYYCDENEVHTDAQDYGINSGTTLYVGINATQTTIHVDKLAPYPGWESSGKFKIGNEIIAYGSVYEHPQLNIVIFSNCTRGSDGTTPASHNTGDTVKYFANPDEVIKVAVAHEAGHGVSIGEDSQASIMMKVKAGKSSFNTNFRKTGPVPGSTQQFCVK